MFASAMKLPSFTLSALAGMLLFTLSGVPAPAQAPGQVKEVITPEATVVSTAHYQAVLELSCFGNGCAGDFPPPGTNRRLKVTRIACRLVGTTNVVATYGLVAVVRPNDSWVVHQYLPVDRSVVTTVANHTLNQAVDLLVGANQHIRVSWNTNLAPGNATCTATGTLDKLK